MEKKLLLAVDGSSNSKNAVSYAIQMSPFIKKAFYTLFHVQPHISQYLVDEAKGNIRAEMALEKLRQKNILYSKTMLKDLKSDMIGMGIDSDRIEIKTQARKIGLSKDIIELAQEGLYDAVIAGRRGLSRLQEVFLGSLTAKLVEHSRVIPLWIVDAKSVSEKIMIAVDGSESSLRAVDHASFIFEKNPNILITLFHVMPMLQEYCEIDFKDIDSDILNIISKGDKRCIDNFMSHALKKFKAAGIGKDQIQLKQAKRPLSVGKAIFEEIRKNNYGTVIVGRRGMDKAFFMGRVSTYLFYELTGRTLWIVP